jgi:hypothetical protein
MTDSPGRVAVQVGRVRRFAEQRVDQAIALTARRLRRPLAVAPYDGEPRLAVVTVNRDTTHFLQLMLVTLAEQEHLELVERLVIVDNGSRDGGAPFLRDLAARVPRVELVENRHRRNHARGIRSGLSRLDALDRALPGAQRANLLVFVDSDVIFRNPQTLLALAATITEQDGAFAGELRRLHEYPDAQASFFGVRRDVVARRDVKPWVNHGSPAYWLQRSIWQAGLTVVDFPSNQGGWILHRGRSAVAAQREWSPRGSYASATNHKAHYMGVPGGAEIWAEIEARHASLLAPDGQGSLLVLLAERFSRFGAD